MPYPDLEPRLPYIPLLSHTSTVIRKGVLSFYVLFCLMAAAVFIANLSHQTQQGTYGEYYLPLAQSLLDGKGYVLPPMGSTSGVEPAFYPLWGYSLLVAAGTVSGNPDRFLMILQYLLCLAGIIAMYRLFNIEERYRHLPFLIPFIALMSVKWPDAIIAPLLIFHLLSAVRGYERKDWKLMVLSGAFLGLICNFRPEYLPFPLLLLPLALLPRMRGKRSVVLRQTAYIFVTALLFLLPWAFRSYSYDGTFRLTSTNGGSVAYISLGQLPDNRWGIVSLDRTAADYTATRGEPNPYSIQGDRLLRERWQELVSASPGEYARKAFYNTARGFTGGLYIGEYGILDNQRTEEIKRDLDAGLFHAWRKLDTSERLYLLIKLATRGLFLFLLAATLFWEFRDRNNSWSGLLVLALLGYKFITISLIQYEPRHMNALYPFVFGGGLLFLSHIARPAMARIGLWFGGGRRPEVF